MARISAGIPLGLLISAATIARAQAPPTPTQVAANATAVSPPAPEQSRAATAQIAGASAEDTAIYANDCDHALKRAEMIGLNAMENNADNGQLRYRWRMTEKNITFPSDEFDKAQSLYSVTMLITGQGERDFPFTFSRDVRSILRFSKRWGPGS